LKASARTREATRADGAVVPVVHEEIAVGKRRVRTGTVRVRKIVRERVAVVDEPLVRERVVVERLRLDRVVDAPPPPRHEGDTLVVTVVEEVLVKQLRAVEEIRITKQHSVARRPTRVPLRREEVTVERDE
jgi:stress response protein YsnF